MPRGFKARRDPQNLVMIVCDNRLTEVLYFMKKKSFWISLEIITKRI